MIQYGWPLVDILELYGSGSVGLSVWFRSHRSGKVGQRGSRRMEICLSQEVAQSSLVCPEHSESTNLAAEIGVNLYGSGSVFLNKMSGKVAGEWRSSWDSRLFRATGLASQESVGEQKQTPVVQDQQVSQRWLERSGRGAAFLKLHESN